MNRILFTTLMIGLFINAGCSGKQWIAVQAFDDKNALVFVEELGAPASGVQTYSHPFAIDESQLAAILAGIRYNPSKVLSADSDQAVFSQRETAALAPLLATALGEADSKQRIRFVSYNRGPALLLPSRRKTEGIAFVDTEGRLNIAFSLINEVLDVEEHDVPTTPHPVDPLQITHTMRPLIPRPWYYVGTAAGSQEQAPMWAVVDLKSAPAAAAVLESSAVLSEKQESAKNAGDSRPASGASVAVTNPQPSDSDPRLFREKLKDDLRLLKELHEEGLITDEDYGRKKQELLDKIH